MTGWAWLNGRVLPEEEARVSIRDRGFLYGDGVFETLRVYDGAPFQLDAHLARLQYGAARLGIEGVPSTDDLCGAVCDLFARGAAPESMLRIVVTRGESPGGWRGPAPERPTVLIVLRPSPLPPDDWYEAGVAAVWCDVPMMQAPWWPGDVKHNNWLPRILAKPQVDAAGAAEGFLRTARGTLAEGLTSNVFVVRGGVVRAPTLADGALAGVTRQVVLDLADELDMPCTADDAVPGEWVESADEVFYTNAGLGLVPVVTFAGRPVGAGVPGPVWRKLHGAYREAVRG